MEILKTIAHYWYLIPVLVAVLAWKPILRVVGMVIVPENKIGLVTKKFVLFGPNKQLSGDRIIATKGEAGYQAQVLSPGVHWGLFPWQFSVDMENFVVIPEGKIGLINAKDGKIPQTGRILGRKVACENYQDAEKFLTNEGQKGRQSGYITTGTYKINTFLFEVSTVSQVTIQENMVGVVTTLDGEPLTDNQIAGERVEGHNLFQDFDKFLVSGGKRGLQQQIVLAGTYNINPWAVQIEEVKMTEIPIGHVGVVISFIGEEGVDLTGKDFKHGNLVDKGKKGVWAEPLNPGKYALNPYTIKVETVPTTNLVLNWADARSESHKLDANLSTITVRSKDGFTFNLDVSQIIHIPSTEAPKVIARFGNMINLVSQVLEPTIGNYFRNSAQDSDVIAFLSTRKERQDAAKEKISAVLEEYNVHAVDTLIGDITPPADLMKTLTDRKIASENQTTYKTQMEAEKQRQTLAKERSIADMQGEVVRAEQSVNIAAKDAEAMVKKRTGEAQSVKIAAEAAAEATKLKADAESYQVTKMGEAESNKTLAIGKATAESYTLAVNAMGADNFVTFKVTEEIGKSKIKLMPDVLIGGGGNETNGGIAGLLGLQILDKLGRSITPPTKVVEVPSTDVTPVVTDKK